MSPWDIARSWLRSLSPLPNPKGAKEMLLLPHGVIKRIWSLMTLEALPGSGECQSNLTGNERSICGVCWEVGQVVDIIWGLWVFLGWGWLLLLGLRLHGVQPLPGQEARMKTLFRVPSLILSNECSLPCQWVPWYLVCSAVSLGYIYVYRLLMTFKVKKQNKTPLFVVLYECDSNRGGSDFQRHFDIRWRRGLVGWWR